MAKKCRGCGAELQFEDEGKPEFVPENIYWEREEIICKRCFKLKNYGDYMPVDVSEESYKREVKKMMNETDVVLLIVDIIDFEGSFDNTLVELIGKKKVMLIINKTDLVPGRKHPSEIAEWVRKRIAGKKMNLLDICVISAKDGYGVKGILKKLAFTYKDGARIGVMGVTNVGKSSLINSFFEGDEMLTVSKYPGTTLNTVRRKIKGTNFEIIDTPGLIPPGRISDMVCSECSLRMVPSREITRKTYKLKQNKIILVGGLIRIKILSDSEMLPIFVLFAADGVKFHATNEERYKEILFDYSGDWVIPPCDSCKDEFYSLKTKTEIIEIPENKDLVFKGLGWISVRRGPLKIEVTMPEKAETVIRNAFIKPTIDRNAKIEE